MKEADLEIKIEAELEVAPPPKGSKGKDAAGQILIIKNCGGAPIFTQDFLFSLVLPGKPEAYELELPDWILSLRPRQSSACESGRIPVGVNIQKGAEVVLLRRDTREEAYRTKVRILPKK